MSRIKVLYIEDDDKQRRSFAETLRSTGFDVQAVASGKAGIQTMEKHRTDVILCDLNMPEMNGLDVLKQIKQFDTELPVIILTGHGTLDLAVKSLKLGAYDFVLKPLEIKNIETTIQKAIEKIKLEKELRQSQSSLQMLMENVPDIIYSLNPKGEFLSLNPAVEALLGYKPAEMLGTSVFKYIYSEDWERVKASFQKAMKCCDVSVKTLEFRMLTKTGEIRDFEVNRKLIFENGKVIRQDGIARDVTHRKQFKEELQKYSAELEILIDERTKKLEYTTRQLAALNAVSNRFTQIYDEDALFEEVPVLLTHSLDFDRAVLFIAKNGLLTLRSFCLEKDPPELVARFLKTIREKKGAMPPHLQESFQQNKTIFIPDLNADPRWPKAAAQLIRTKAVVVAPIKVKKKSIGVIVGNMQHHAREMDPQDVARFEMFVNIVGLALDNIRTYQSLERKVVERTKSLRNVNRELRKKAKQLEKSTYAMAHANVELLSVQEQLEKKNAEMENLLKALAESNRRLEALLDSSLSAIIMVDKDNRVISANKRIQEFFGLEFKEILNKPIQLFSEKIKDCFADFNKLSQLVNELQQHPDPAYDEGIEIDKIYERSFKLIKPVERFVSVFSVPVLDKDNQELGKVWTYTDITKMKRAEEQLRTIVEASPIPFIVSRQTDGKIFYANEPMAELIGLHKDELIGRFTPDFYFSPTDRQIVVEKIKRDGFLHDHEVRIKKSDGSGRWMIFSIETAEVGGDAVFIGALYDINERKQAEEALRESEEKFRQLTENINEVFWIIDNQTKQLLYLSPAFEGISGHPRESVYHDPSAMFAAVHPEDITRVRTAFAKQIEQEHIEEYRIVRPDKSIRWIRERAFPVRNHKGEVYRICGVSEDFTERKLADEKLANRLRYEEGLAACSRTLLEGRDNHDALQEAIKHLLKAVDVDRVYIFENFADENDGMCIRQTHEVCAPGVKPEIENPLLQHLPYKEGLTRWQNKLSTGEPLQGLVETFPQEEKDVLEPQGILSILALPINVGAKWFGFIGFDDVKNKRNWNDEDIRLLQTAAEMIGGYIEHQQAEEALHESEERFRNLVENANDIIYSLTPEGKFTYVPPNWKDILGHEVSEVLGKSFEPFVHPEDLSTCREFLHKVFESGEKQSGIEYRVKHKNGSWRWHISSASPFKDENGKVLYYIGIAHDITERKKFLDDLAEANRHLRETQAQLVQSEKMASLGMLVAGIAHEMNTPIGAVHSMHDTLKRAVNKLKQTLETQFPKEYQENHALSTPIKIIDDANKVIENGSERVINIVRRLRSFARLDEAELKTVDIHEGLEDTLTLIHHQIKHNITVTKNFAELPDIACFPGRLNQVYLNLLINAKQAIRDKGEISITTFQKKGNVHIEIQDSGVGISRDKLSRIFDPGFTTKGVGVGTGLGLSICYQIIQDHKGEIQVKSEVGKGSTFTIVFPMNLDELLENT